MSGNRLELEGLSELRAALRALPVELADKGADLVDGATERTAASLVQAYPPGPSGKLRRGVSHTVTRSAGGAIGTVVSRSPEAHLWEFGTQNRRTRQGWNRGRGPAHHNEGLVGIAQRERRTLTGELVDLVRAGGFEVSGDA